MFYFSVLSKENNHLSAAPMSFCLQNDRAIRESPLRRSRTINENLQLSRYYINISSGFPPFYKKSLFPA
jgi:hypothetical protein